MYLPTLSSGAWSISAFLQSLKTSLNTDSHGERLIVYSYALTSPGWREIESEFVDWRRRRAGRTIVAYIGTDHGLAEPDAVRAMVRQGIKVRIMCRYRGVFHPKVLWLQGPKGNKLWVGSNNLTREGLVNNIEFALMLDSATANPDLIRWHDAVHAGSEPFDEALLSTYETERTRFAQQRVTAPGTFTWSKKEEPPEPRAARALRFQRSRELVLEVMPRETGTGGSQIQLPKDAAVQFFGLSDGPNASRRINLTVYGTSDTRTLTLTLFKNNTVRLSVSELDYRDRPCLLVFRPSGGSNYTVEIVKESIFPTRYRTLLRDCTSQTRIGSRRWTIA